MLNISFLKGLTDHRLKSLKISLYKKRRSTYSICECCKEIRMYDHDGFKVYDHDIKKISIVQMSRKSIKFNA